MYAGEAVIDVILGQHDFADTRKQLRLVFPHPQQLGRGKARKGNVGGAFAQRFLADRPVQILHLLLGAAIVPENGGANHLVMLVQHHKAVHLAACGDARHLRGVKAPQQLRHTGQDRPQPVVRVLLAPAGLGKFQRIFLGNDVEDLAALLHEQQLEGGGAQIKTDEIHGRLLSFFFRQHRIILRADTASDA